MDKEKLQLLNKLGFKDEGNTMYKNTDINIIVFISEDATIETMIGIITGAYYKVGFERGERNRANQIKKLLNL